MPLLFFLSGYLARSTIFDQQRAIGRGADLAWIYAIWTGIGWLSNGWNFVELLFTPSSALWYIWGLAFAAVTLPVACRMPPAVVTGAAATVAMTSYAHLLKVDPYTTEHLLRHFVFFYVGLYAGKPIVTVLMSRSAITLFASATIVAVTHVLNEVTSATLSVPLLALPERAALVTAVLNVCLLMPAVLLKPFAWFGRRSLQIYVGHVMLLSPLRAVVTDMAWASHVVIVAASATGISLAAHRAARLSGLRFLYSRPRIRRDAFQILLAPVLGRLRDGMGTVAALVWSKRSAGQRR